jgi:hypothetical protein
MVLVSKGLFASIRANIWPVRDLAAGQQTRVPPLVDTRFTCLAPSHRSDLAILYSCRVFNKISATGLKY